MRVHVVSSQALEIPEAESCLVVPVYERGFPLMSEVLAEGDELLLQALADKEIYTGKAAAPYFLPVASRPYRNVFLAGLGKPEKFSPEVLRRAAGSGCGLFSEHRITHLYIDITHHADLPVAAFVEGVILGQYDFDVYRKQPEDAPPPVKVQELTVIAPPDTDAEALQQELQLAALLALSTNGARHLANTAPNEMTPTALAVFAEGIAKESGCECVVLDELQIASLGMNALLAVSSGSAQPPKFIVLRHEHPEAAKTLAIVGKGITFDSGGISIKPAEGMHEMKYDMCGAAAVLCAMLSIVEFKPKVNVVCVVPAAENMTGPAAQRPGDIVKACNGVAIEVLNTDAEGRMILADALAYTISKYKPDAVVDLATLTGACVVALGHYAAGMMGNDDALARDLQAAGEETGERLWPFPLWEDYEKLIESDHADIANSGPRGEAGAITAAAFLKRFAGDTPWVHLDIAGTAWGAKNVSYLSTKHASGFGVRLLVRWILAQAQR